MRLVSRIPTSRRNRRLRGTIDSQTEENSDQRKLLIRENYYGRILKPNHNRVSCFPKFEPITRLTFLSQVFVYYTGILSLGKRKG